MVILSGYNTSSPRVNIRGSDLNVYWFSMFFQDDFNEQDHFKIINYDISYTLPTRYFIINLKYLFTSLLLIISTNVN